MANNAMTAEAVLEQYAKDRNLRWTDLRGADLRWSDLREADLYGANLHGANLDGALGIVQHSIVPQKGAFTGFKKLADGTICELLIPADAERVGGLVGRKCRASKAVVVSGSGFSRQNEAFKYEPGETVVPDSYDPFPGVECSHGIHFFITREEAEDF